MNITVFYVGTSLLAPFKRAEADINRQHSLELRLALYNCGGPLDDEFWVSAEQNIEISDLIFVIHVTDDHNSRRLVQALDQVRNRAHAVVAFNCMPDLMRCGRLGNLDFGKLVGRRSPESGGAQDRSEDSLVRKIASWMHDSIRGRSRGNGTPARARGSAEDYVALISRLPLALKYLPLKGKLGDIKNYLYLFGYFLQPTPENIRSMILYAIKEYVPGSRKSIKVSPPETLPATGIYHPDAPSIFSTFASYRKWYEKHCGSPLSAENTVGLLLMRPQVVSQARRHYDGLIHALEDEGLSVIPALSTFMDNRSACRRFFMEGRGRLKSRGVSSTQDSSGQAGTDSQLKPLVSQIVSLTGFSFVGGPAMNDSEAAARFFELFGIPFRSLISLDLQTIENWEQNRTGVNPVQIAMQVAIPEIDGATEPLVFGGIPAAGTEPAPLEERCRKIARRLSRWNRLRVAPRSDLRPAFLVFCFPPDKGNIGTAADLDVFPSLWRVLDRLKDEGYDLDLPSDPTELRTILLEGNSDEYGTVGNVADRMSVADYLRFCPDVEEVEAEWGLAPGKLNTDGRDILILGRKLGNCFVGIQPTFGYEGDPMRLLMAENGSPHHGFRALYTYLEHVFQADAVIHVGTHGALEFMPGKQVGLSSRCWPDRLIGELPNIYIYSANNPSEGTIAKRRSYAELISYLTPPIENAGLYKELASLKELITAYRRSASEAERDQLYELIEQNWEEIDN